MDCVDSADFGRVTETYLTQPTQHWHHRIDSAVSTVASQRLWTPSKWYTTRSVVRRLLRHSVAIENIRLVVGLDSLSRWPLQKLLCGLTRRLFFRYDSTHLDHTKNLSQRPIGTVESILCLPDPQPLTKSY